MTQNPNPYDLDTVEFKVGNCPIWKGFPASRISGDDGWHEITSYRTGGSYRVAREATNTVEQLRNYLKTVVGADGGTRAGRRPTG